MLGSQALRSAPRGVEVVPTDRRDADLADPAQVVSLLERVGALSGVLHIAGYSNVDRAELHEDEAQRDNAGATACVAAACARSGLPLLTVSSDFVFNGRQDRPYTEDDAPDPISAYGRSKLAAERAALDAHAENTRIARVQWLYGPRGNHFPGRILELARERAGLDVVDDQTGTPTSTPELAPALWDLLLRGAPGVYHVSCEGHCSRYEYARAIVEEAGIGNVEIRPCSSLDMPRPAPRPAYSVLDSSRLALLRGRPLAHWREALRRYLSGSDRPG